MHRVSALTIPVLFCLLFSCSTTKTARLKTAGAEENKILFLAYELTRDSISGEITPRRLYQRLEDGSIKPGSIEDAPQNAGNWQIKILSTDDHTLTSLVVENPFHQQLEYVGNDGAFQMKEIWLTRAELVIRINYTRDMTLLIISAPAKNGIFNRVLMDEIRPNNQ